MLNIYVYILKSLGNNKRYVGITNNISRKLKEHQVPILTVSKNLGVFKLIKVEKYPNYTEARKREKYHKSGKGREWSNIIVGRDQL